VTDWKSFVFNQAILTDALALWIILSLATGGYEFNPSYPIILWTHFFNKFGDLKQPCEKSSHFGSVSFEDSIQNFIIKGCLELDLFSTQIKLNSVNEIEHP
jgi:hypothetical protein